MRVRRLRGAGISGVPAYLFLLSTLFFAASPSCRAEGGQAAGGPVPTATIDARGGMTVHLPPSVRVEGESPNLEVFSLRGRKVMNLLPVGREGRDPVYRLGSADSGNVRSLHGIHMATIAAAGVRYAWIVRAVGGGLTLGREGKAFVLGRDVSVGRAPAGRERPGGSGFIDETGARLPTMQDETARVIAADIDGDGDLDILLAEFGSAVTQNRVWINDGKGYFTDETAARLPEIMDFSNDLDVADIDGDNDLDIVIANSLFEDSYILRNDGDGHFTQVSGSLPTYMDDSWGVRFCDVTGDNRPDIIFANALARNRLFLNEGTGAFMDVTEENLPPDTTDSFEVCCRDVNGDSANDIIFFNLDINFGLQNRLLINDGTGHFSDSTSSLMPDISDGSFDGELIDVNGDRLPDGIVADKWLYDFFTGDSIPGTGKNLVLTNHSSARPGWFVDESAARMPDLFDWTNGVAAADIDGQDGPDLAFANGARGKGAVNRIYLNDGSGYFTDMTASWLPLREELSSDVVLFDADGDGDNDMVIANIPPDTVLADAQNRIFINQTIVGIGDVPGASPVPTAFALSQNYPNPFNPSTTVDVTVPEGSDEKTFIGIYTLRGRLVRVIEEGILAPGQYRFTWDGRGESGETLPSGIYILSLKTGASVLTRKMSLVK